MKNIEQVIRGTYFDYHNARQHKSVGMKPPEIEPYKPSEVSVLVDAIVNEVNSHIASMLFTPNVVFRQMDSR